MVLGSPRSRSLIWCLAVVVLSGCKKDDKDCPTDSVPPDGRNQFAGQYKVYDTTGVYLYPMEIFLANDAGRDSLFVVNWGGRFDFYVRHENGDLTNGLGIIPPFPSYDHQGYRWGFFHEADAQFHSGYLINDTLRMSYSISNIAFYAEDGVPFFALSFREYGVKQ